MPRDVLISRACFFGGVVGALVPGQARSQPPVALRLPQVAWEAPAGCPSADEVRRSVAAMLAGSASTNAAADVVARAAISEVGGGFVLHAEIRTRDGIETKTVDAASCATLADAYAVVVAFAIDPGAAPVAGAAASAAPPPTSMTFEPPALERPPPSTPAPGVRVAIGPLVASGVGLLPFPAYGVGGRAALETNLRWELAAMYWPTESTTASAGAATGLVASVSLASIQPSLCVPLASRALAACAGTEVGSMRAAGSGVLAPGSGSWWWVAPTASLGVRLSLTEALSFWLRVDVGVLLYRRSFVFEGAGFSQPVVAQEPAPVFASLSFEPELQLFGPGVGEVHHAGR